MTLLIYVYGLCHRVPRVCTFRKRLQQMGLGFLTNTTGLMIDFFFFFTQSILKFSATCRDTYGMPDLTYTAKGEEIRALCTSEYSDISPLHDGNLAFGTLEGRPSAYNFDSSPDLQVCFLLLEVL